VVVARHGTPGEMPAGIRPSAIVVTDVPLGHPAPSEDQGIPTVNLREDRTLAGFSTSEAQAALNAEILVPAGPGGGDRRPTTWSSHRSPLTRVNPISALWGEGGGRAVRPHGHAPRRLKAD
jgi:hypothetical protein